MACIRLGDKTQLHRFPIIVGPLLNRRDIRKQTKATTRVANPSLGNKMRAAMLVLREAMTDILMTHGTISTPNVMDDMRMKLINSQPSART